MYEPNWQSAMDVPGSGTEVVLGLTGSDPRPPKVGVHGNFLRQLVTTFGNEFGPKKFRHLGETPLSGSIHWAQLTPPSGGRRSRSRTAGLPASPAREEYPAHPHTATHQSQRGDVQRGDGPEGLRWDALSGGRGPLRHSLLDHGRGDGLAEHAVHP